MKVFLLLLLSLVSSIQINNKYTGLAQLEKRTSVEATSEVQWFLVDDIFIWVYCKIWKCNKDSGNAGPAKEEKVKVEYKTLKNDSKLTQSNSSNKSNSTNSTATSSEGSKDDGAKGANATTPAAEPAPKKLTPEEEELARMTPEEREEYELQMKLKAAKEKNLDKNSNGVMGSEQRKDARKSEDIAEGRLPKPVEKDPKPVPAAPVDPKKKLKEDKEDAEDSVVQKKKLYKAKK